MRLLYTCTIFLGALLVFLVQPMAGKLLLPWLGGTPAVWNTCMVFFQSALLAGYAYAHVLSRWRTTTAQAITHGAVLLAAAICLPVAFDDPPPEMGAPVLWLLWSLAVTVGLPFVALSAGAPLLQKWFATTDDPQARDPYFLYAASNAGSLLALLSYPLLVEPLSGTATQSLAWSVGYVLVIGMTVACGVVAARHVRSGVPPNAVNSPSGSPETTETRRCVPPGAPPPDRRNVARWLALAFVPSSLMLGATQHITTDVAAVPLLWVVPLAIYLATFIFAFARRQLMGPERASRLMLIVALPALALSVLWWNLPVWLVLGVHLAVLFLAALACHAQLAALRPHPSHLTTYFLAIAAGGALGGLFNTLVAPLLFETVVEYPLAIALAIMLRVRTRGRKGREFRTKCAHVAVDVIVVFLTLAARPFYAYLPDFEILHLERSFFGVHCVADTNEGSTRIYYQGTTLHGVQMPGEPRSPRGYYHEASGIGRVFTRLRRSPRLDDVGLIGLGAGAIGAYAQPGQRFTFFEIDPVVVKIARDPALFTYLASMPAPPRIVVGDGRVSLAREPDGAFGLLVLDAFSSDAIPVHLLTVEAMDLYFGKLSHDGLLAIHATNRHVDLGRLVAGLARERDLAAVEYRGAELMEPDLDEGLLYARWFVLGRSELDLQPLLTDRGWMPVKADDDAPAWTDDYSDILSVLHWRQ